MATRLSVVAVIYAICATALFAQQQLPFPPRRVPDPQRQSVPTFRGGVELVQVDVLVTDEDGKPVTGLTADDFEVFEDGRRQVITTFSPVNIPIEHSEPLPFDAEPDVLSNNRPPGHVYVFILAGTDPDSALRARHLMRRFLDEHFGDNDIGAVITGRTYPGDRQDFTSNRRLLLAAVDKFAGDAMDVLELADLMEMLARIPGARKVVVWIGGPPPLLDPFDLLDRRPLLYSRRDDAMHAAMAATTRGNIRWYVIDPRGLTAEGGSGADESAPVIVSDGGAAASSLRALAAITGGSALVNSNSFSNVFARLVTETSTYYLLGFESSHRRAEGRYVRLEVKVKRPGLKVRSRTGYLEQLRYRSRTPYVEPQRTPVEAALANPMATPGVGMHVFAAAYKGKGRDATVALAVDVDGSQLTFDGTNGTFTGGLELDHVAIDVNHKIFPAYRHRAMLTLDAADLERLKTSGIRVVAQFDVPKGRYQVRVAAASGTQNGSVVYDVDVPDFTADPLMLSGVSIAALSPNGAVTLRPVTIKRRNQQTRQCRAAACQATAVMESTLGAWDGTDKATETYMFKDALPVPPTTTREFASADTLALYAEVYDNIKRVKTDPTYAITVTASLRDSTGAIMRDVSEERSSSSPRQPSGGHGITMRLPLAGTSPGVYLLQVEARSSRDPSLLVSRKVPVRIR